MKFSTKAILFNAILRTKIVKHNVHCMEDNRKSDIKYMGLKTKTKENNRLEIRKEIRCSPHVFTKNKLQKICENSEFVFEKHKVSS